MQNNLVFDNYKPLRNHIRKLYLSDALKAIWAHSQYQQFKDFDIQKYVQVIPEYLEQNGVLKCHIFLWELEILAKEIIIHADSSYGEKSFCNWPYLWDGISKLKNLENEICKIYVGNNVLVEVNRIAHRQFPWQIRPNLEDLVRYFKIFKNKELEPIIEKTFGMSSIKVYQLGMSIIGLSLNYAALDYPPNLTIEGITQEDLDNFLDHFSCEIGELRDILLKEQEYNEKFVYSFSSLRKFPIIKMDYEDKYRLVFPIPTLLFWRFTSGIYYELVGQTGFDQKFGKSFQNYVGEILYKSCPKLQIFSEDEYHLGKIRKDAVDWLIEDNNSVLLIECKTKRLAMGAKVCLVSTEDLEKELDKMASFVVQLYKTIVDYKNNKYKTAKYTKGKNIYPLVVTLENWFIFGNELVPILDKKIIEQLKANSLSENYIKEMPYSVCSVRELEELIQIVNQVGIKNVVGEKQTSDEYRFWAYESYISHQFSNEKKNVKPLFNEESKILFEEGNL